MRVRVVLIGLTGGVGALGCGSGLAVLGWRTQLAAQQPGDVLLALAAAAAALVLARLGCCALTAALAAALAAGTGARSRTADRLAVRLSPGLLRPLVASALGLTVGLAGATAATADAGHRTTAASAAATPTSPATTLPAPGWAPTSEPAHEIPQPGWVASAPSTPSTRPAEVALLSAGGSSPRALDRGGSAHAVVVRRGDCLWTLAARQLGADASDAQVAAHWHRWWSANRAVIGADPDRLVPGTRLVVPAAAGQPR
jgi:nucleoid-associated protein YgaU